MGKRSTRELPLVLGLNAAYHESAAAIIRGFEVVFAAEEERYTREKHAKVARVTNPDQLPWFAIRDCLRAANCTKLSDVDAVAYSLMPGKRLAMIGSDPYPISEAVGFGTEWGEHTFDHRVRSVPEIISAASRGSLAWRRLSLHTASSCACGLRLLCVWAGIRGSARSRWDRGVGDHLAGKRQPGGAGDDRGDSLSPFHRHAVGTDGGVSRLWGV